MLKGILLVLILCVSGGSTTVGEEHFTNDWAAEIPGGTEVAKRVARENGYELLHEVSKETPIFIPQNFYSVFCI